LSLADARFRFGIIGSTEAKSEDAGLRLTLQLPRATRWPPCCTCASCWPWPHTVANRRIAVKRWACAHVGWECSSLVPHINSSISWLVPSGLWISPAFTRTTH